MQLPLTPDQSKQVTDAFKQIGGTESDTILCGQIMREDWKKGAGLYLAVHPVKRSTASKMRDAFLKAEGKCDRTEKIVDVNRG